MLPAGMFSHRVRLERRIEAADGYGNVQASWATPRLLGRRWAAFTPASAREDLKAGRLADGITGVLTLRSCAVTRDLTAADRITFESGPYRDRTMSIIGVLPTRDASEIEVTVEQYRD